jgi:hypothetical protein
MIFFFINMEYKVFFYSINKMLCPIFVLTYTTKTKEKKRVSVYQSFSSKKV